MKLKIKVKLFDNQQPLEIISKGDWIDLRANATLDLHKDGKVTYIPLGVAMEMPKGMYAPVVARSSTPKKFGIICANSVGIIDYVYKGDTDEWKFPALAIRETTILKGERICQFMIMPSQKATFWQKLKWLLSSGIKIEYVDNLNNESRGGFGTTGKR